MEYKRLAQFIESLPGQGRYTFTLQEVRGLFDRSDSAINAALFRASRKGLTHAIRKGFYVVVTPEYRPRGILPPVLFIDGLMQYLGRKYYAGLLSAATMHGAAHQQPQEFQIITQPPALRTISAHGVRIRFFCKRIVPEKGIMQMKTDTGQIQVSSPELTSIDLIMFERRIGGIDRAAEVFTELAPMLNQRPLLDLLPSVCPVAVAQRIGYLLDTIAGNKELADVLHGSLRNRTLFPVPLSTVAPVRGTGPANRWKIIVNTRLEGEE